VKIIPDAMRRPAEIERDELRRRLAEIEEREAACCQEDVPFDEHIKALESKFEQMREALEAVVRVADRATVEFNMARAAIKAAKGEM
jgi:hypothetical protein